MADNTTKSERAAQGADERRIQPRYEVTAYVDYTGSEVLLYHRIENISLGGICIQSTSVEQVDTIVDLVVSFPDLGTSVALQGQVVWCNTEEPMDMGIRYIDLDNERKEILRKHIRAIRDRQGGPYPGSSKTTG